MAALKVFGLSLDEVETIELERIVIDDDRDGALRFIKEVVYRRVVEQRTNKLQSHLDVSSGDPVQAFERKTGTGMKPPGPEGRK